MQLTLNSLSAQPLSALKQAWNAHREAQAHRKAVQETVTELTELDDAMLADIGIYRGSIRSVAEAVADQSNH